MKRDKILADYVNEFVGSGTFIAGQSLFLLAYVVYQTTVKKAFDPFPFILLNLLLSFQAAYTGPFVLWSQNRAAERDRKTMQHIESMAEQIKDLAQRNMELEQKILRYVSTQK
jgi:uncharacterized membrane protein